MRNEERLHEWLIVFGKNTHDMYEENEQLFLVSMSNTTGICGFGPINGK